jgi:hypothetical protein
MDNGNEDPDYDAVQELIHEARIERALAVGDAIGQACAMTWRAITIAADTLQAVVMNRDHA